MLSIEVDPAIAELAGNTRFDFADPQSPIVFGRSSSATIRLRPSEKRLGRVHFELRRVAGGYELATDRNHPVFLDGERFVGTVPLAESGTVLRLLDPRSGPTISIKFRSDDTDPTATGEKPTGLPIPHVLRKLRQDGARIAIALAGAIVLVAIALSLSHYDQLQWRQAFLAQTRALADELDKHPAWQKIADEAKKAVYQVAVRTPDGDLDPRATAWVIGPGTLVTAAHVVREIDKRAIGLEYVAVSPEDARKQFPIIAVREDEAGYDPHMNPKIHQAYDAFRELIGSVEHSASLKPIGSYDVALIRVIERGNGKLGDPLKLADRDELLGLAPGQDIMWIGYPTEGSRHDTQLQLRPGVISGLTDFFGIARGSRSELIYHTAAGKGGASGSPILNREGKVVGVFTGGETIDLKLWRFGDGSQTFFAQNGLLVHDLLQFSEEGLDEAKAHWKSAIGYLRKRHEVWSTIEAHRDADSLDLKGVSQAFAEAGTLAASADGRAAFGESVFSATIEAKGTYLAFALPRGDGELRMRLTLNQAAVSSPLYVDAVPVAVFEAGAGQIMSIALSGAPGTQFDVKVIRLGDEAPGNTGS